MDNSMNKTVCSFEYKGRSFEVDMLLDSKHGGDSTQYVFDVYDVTKSIRGGRVAFFDGYEGCDYKKLALEELNNHE